MDTSLKDEIDSEINSLDNSKRKLAIAGAVVVVIACSTGIAWVRPNPSPRQDRSTDSQQSETSIKQVLQRPDQDPAETKDEDNKSATTPSTSIESPQVNEIKLHASCQIIRSK